MDKLPTPLPSIRWEGEYLKHDNRIVGALINDHSTPFVGVYWDNQTNRAERTAPQATLEEAKALTLALYSLTQ